MNGNAIISLGLGLQEPWKITGQTLDTEKTPHELRLEVSAERGAKYPCPECGAMCNAHDFITKTWRHLNFFQHHCYVTAPVPRVRCLEHGVKQIKVPWARPGSKFTLLFEEAAILLTMQMPVSVCAGLLEIDDKMLWRIIGFHVNRAMAGIDLSQLKAFAVDETSARREHRYVTVFTDQDRKTRPVAFAVPGKGKETIKAFKNHLESHGGAAGNVRDVVSDMSGPFLAGIGQHFGNARKTVDWFHAVQLFTKALDQTRRLEAKTAKLPTATRWAVLKSGNLTEKQENALSELQRMNLHTASAWRVKKMLRWVRLAATPQAAKWRMTNFLSVASELAASSPLLAPVRKALATVQKHRQAILARWESGYSNARAESLNGIFQAANRRARGYRNGNSFITIIYLLAAPIHNILKST